MNEVVAPVRFISCSIRAALEQHEELIKPYLSADVSLTEGKFLFVPRNCNITKPFHEIFDTQINVRNIIVISENAQAVFIEEYVSSHTERNSLTQIFLERNAQLQYCKIQNENLQATHIADIFVKQKQDSIFKSFSLSRGSQLARDNLQIELQQRGAECCLKGLYYLQTNGQQIENQLCVKHLAEYGASSMLYKGILDKKSRAIFNGKVFVEQNAQKTNAQQANHNLLLSTDSEIKTKPELEIYADDVKCAHGATVGQLDSEALFYLQSRGVEKAAAKKMLTHAFANELIATIEQPDIMKLIQTRVDQYEKL